MKVLISGATGLIGQAIGQELVRRGHSVVALSRDIERARMQLSFPCEIRKWKHFSESPEFLAGDKFDSVIHLSGESVADKRWSVEQKKIIYDSRVVGTRVLAEALRDRGVKTWVHGSAIGLYGDAQDQWVSEESPAGNDFLASVVKDWEAEAIKAQNSLSVRLTMIRTGIVLSSQGGALAKIFDIFHRGVGGSLGDGKQYMSWIHIYDLVNLFLFALENREVSGAINGSALHPVSNKEFTSTLARAMGHREFIATPKFALKLALGEMANVVLASVRAKTKADSLGFKFKFTKLDEALEDLCRGMNDKSRVLEAEQFINRPLNEIFEFFSDEHNLEELTPPFLNFKVLGSTTEKVQKGTLIDYQLSLHGIPMKWKTLIKEWDRGKSFIDEQLKGPYEKWHHTHEFESLGNGTLIRDRVLFKLPLGALGDTAASWKVIGDVNNIFKFRRSKIVELFG